jgi:26S proteasome regulatory subunit N2
MVDALKTLTAGNDVRDLPICGEETDLKSQKQELTALQLAFDVYESATQEFLQKLLTALPSVSVPPAANGDAMETDDKPAVVRAAVYFSFNAKDPVTEKMAKVRQILQGGVSIKLTLEFLHRNNKADALILKNARVCLLILRFKLF